LGLGAKVAMSKKQKRFAILATGLVLAYVVTPFVAGLVKTYDRRGPKIFWEEHHEFLYMFGYYLAGHQYQDGKPRVPPTERAWFYGLKGEPIDFDKIQRETEDAIKADK